MSKKICISGYYGFDNFGDEMILDILVYNLKKFQIPIDITVFSVNPKKTTEKLNVKSVNTFKINQIIASLFQCDYLISGGGSLLQDSTSIKSLLYYLFVIASALFFRKKIIIFAQGIGPINNNILKHFTMFLLKKASYITIRDDNSLNLLSKYDIKAQKCPDPVWNINLPKSKNTDKIGVQLREFPLLTDEFILNLAQNINKYYHNKEIIILSLQNNIDFMVCNKLKLALLEINPKINAQIIVNTSNKKIIDEICSLDTLIAMRYHACLIGIKAKVKVLPVNYDIKVEMLAKEFNLIYINSVNDLNDKFEKFVNNDITYSNNFIQYDFKTMENLISN